MIPQLFNDLDESTTISSALLPTPTISSVPSSLGAKSDDLVIFNIEVSGATIYLKPWMIVDKSRMNTWMSVQYG